MSLYTVRSGVNNHPEASVLQHLTDITKKGGVIFPSTDFVVGEAGAGGLNVEVSAGHAIVKGLTAYPVRNSAASTVAIAPNASGSPRISTVILYIDTSVTPGSTDEATDVAVLTSVDGTPAGSPIPKNDADIQTQIGANNPFIRLADITVASGATGISAGDISNSNQRVYIQSPSPKYTITYASTITPNFANSNKQRCILTNDVTIGTPTNMEIGDMLLLELIQDGTGGHGITWFANITWMSPDTSNNTDADKHTAYVIEKTDDGFNGYLAGKEY